MHETTTRWIHLFVVVLQADVKINRRVFCHSDLSDWLAKSGVGKDEGVNAGTGVRTSYSSCSGGFVVIYGLIDWFAHRSSSQAAADEGELNVLRASEVEWFLKRHAFELFWLLEIDEVLF